jgi:methionyl-tRNA formyltransferase
MRILFAGSPSLAVPSLLAAAHAHEVVAVLTSADQPAGRGRAPTCSPVKEAASKAGLRVLQPEKLDAAFLEEVRALAPDILVVAAYGKIFRKSLLDLFPLGGINVHPSLLPRHRGPSPISAAILEGDAETGVTIQHIALKFDTGDILAQERFPLKGDETTAVLSEALAEAGARLLAAVLGELAAGRQPVRRVQDEAAATYCRTISKEDGAVRWEESAAVIERQVRAFDPWPRASTRCAGETLLLLKSHVYPATLAAVPSRDERRQGEASEPGEPGEPGAVLASDREHGLLVRTGLGILAVERLQLQFRKPLDWKSFVNGRPDIIGTRLGA